jgi:hypothetical protein
MRHGSKRAVAETQRSSWSAIQGCEQVQDRAWAASGLGPSPPFPSVKSRGCLQQAGLAPVSLSGASQTGPCGGRRYQIAVNWELLPHGEMHHRRGRRAQQEQWGRARPRAQLWGGDAAAGCCGRWPWVGL